MIAFLLLLVSLLLSSVTIPVASQDNNAQPSLPPAPPDPAMAPIASSPSLSSTSPKAPAWTGCVDPLKEYESVTIGKPTTICFVLANNGDWSTEMDYMRLNFQPIADDYSRFHVPKSFQQLIGSTGETELTKIFPGKITVHSQSQKALSFQKLYYNGFDKVFPFFTAIIAVDKGNVTGITWDDACVFCAEDECEDNTYGFNGEIATEVEAQQPVGSCYSNVDECKTSEKAECDLMLYVVWTGTDSKGKDFTSSANRFSAFPKQSWTDRVNLGLPDWFPESLDDLNPFSNSDSEETNN